MLTQSIQETSKNIRNPQKPPLSAFFALNEALRVMNYVASLKPVNGHSSAPVVLIQKAA